MWFTIPELDGSSVDQADIRLQASARRLDAFLDTHLAQSGLPASALALLGFSQGAGMAYEVGPRRPEQLAGIVAIAGRMKRRDTLAKEIRTTPPFLIMSGADDHLMNSKEPASAAATLQQAGIPVHRFTMPGTGHGISGEGIDAARAFLNGALYQVRQA
jgi:phospholipase/carboxylesterase